MQAGCRGRVYTACITSSRASRRQTGAQDGSEAKCRRSTLTPTWKCGCRQGTQRPRESARAPTREQRAGGASRHMLPPEIGARRFVDGWLGMSAGPRASPVPSVAILRYLANLAAMCHQHSALGSGRWVEHGTPEKVFRFVNPVRHAVRANSNNLRLRSGPRLGMMRWWPPRS